MGWLIPIAWTFALAVAGAALYRATFAIAYLVAGRRSVETGPIAGEPPRFAVLIPAHDEELLIATVIQSIRAARYPRQRIDVHVIADNCSDRTAAIVRELGEHVHERQDKTNPGKGQAIDWVLCRIDLASYDAVAFFDADNIVDPEFFAVMQRALADGGRCLQGYYGIANPNETVMTRLLSVTYVMKNLLFNAGKTRLGLSVILMGTGMVFRSDVLARTGWQAMSIGEDLEQTFCLLEQGERIRFVPEALARAQEATSLSQGYAQRQRWASGRQALAHRARRAIAQGFRTRSIHAIDTGVELLMPTYSSLMNWTAVAGIAALVVSPWTLAPLVVVAAALAYQLFEVVVSLRIMGADARFVRSLAFAPVFLVWKSVIDVLALVGHRRNVWARTDRKPHTESID